MYTSAIALHRESVLCPLLNSCPSSPTGPGPGPFPLDSLHLDSFKASLELGPHVKDSLKDSLILEPEIVKRVWFYKSANRNRQKVLVLYTRSQKI